MDQPKDSMYAEALAPANKEAENSTTVQNDGATTTVGQVSCPPYDVIMM